MVRKRPGIAAAGGLVCAALAAALIQSGCDFIVLAPGPDGASDDGFLVGCLPTGSYRITSFINSDGQGADEGASPEICLTGNPAAPLIDWTRTGRCPMPTACSCR